MLDRTNRFIGFDNLGSNEAVWKPKQQIKIAIDTSVLKDTGISIAEFTVMLYYILGGKGILNKEICSALWEKFYHNKTADF